MQWLSWFLVCTSLITSSPYWPTCIGFLLPFEPGSKFWFQPTKLLMVWDLAICQSIFPSEFQPIPLNLLRHGFNGSATWREAKKTTSRNGAFLAVAPFLWIDDDDDDDCDDYVQNIHTEN